jgi:hypothetical protein
LKRYDRLKREAKRIAANNGHDLGFFLQKHTRRVLLGVDCAPTSSGQVRIMADQLSGAAYCMTCGATVWIEANKNYFSGAAIYTRCWIQQSTNEIQKQEDKRILDFLSPLDISSFRGYSKGNPSKATHEKDQDQGQLHFRRA